MTGDILGEGLMVDLRFNCESKTKTNVMTRVEEYMLYSDKQHN